MQALILAALIAAAPPTGAVVLTFISSRRKIQEVHLLVNSNLAAVQERVALLESHLGLSPGEAPTDRP